MTEQKSPDTKYLEKDDIELVHSIVSDRWKQDGEPIPPFSTANPDNLDALIKLPKSSYFDVEHYPSLASKAAIIFYTLNKKHLFLNGNKRLSVACLVVFLFMNDKRLDLKPNEMTAKALELAQTTHHDDFGDIKKDLEDWIGERLVDFDLSEEMSGK